MLKSFLSRQPETLWKHYVAALSLLMAIVLSSHFLEYHALKSAEHDAGLINMSGKQRMLSQQLILYSKAHIEQNDAMSAYALNQKIVTFETAHETLLQASIDKSVLSSIYLTGPSPLDTIVRDFLDHAKLILADPIANAAHIDSLERKGLGPVLRRLDEAVSGYESLAKSNAQRIHLMQESTLIIAVFVLLLEALFIFLPAQRIVNDSLAKLRDEVDHHTTTHQRLSNFINIAADLYWETDLEYRISYVEGRFLKHLQGGRDSLIGCKYTDLAELDEDQAFAMRDALEKLSSYRDIRAQFVAADGVTYVINLCGMPRYNSDGSFAGYFGTAEDITGEVNLLGEVTRQALTDPLTNVANIRAFDSDLRLAFESASEAQPVCLMALDLDDFKPINDTFGHGAGDDVIRIIAQRIQSVLRNDAWVARTGGDEFCVVCTNSDALTLSRSVARRIQAAVAAPIQLDNGTVVAVGLSIGIAEAPTHAPTFEALKKAADTALYAAKSAGKNAIRIATDGRSGRPSRNLKARYEVPNAETYLWSS